MKFKKLSINNIASIGEAEIDFGAEPLKNSSIFLISGPTGSGKTTILDCVCLCLYDKTPRMNVGKRETAILEDDEDTYESKVYDTKALLRQTTKKGWTKLVFEGNDGIEYVALWEVEKSKSRSGNVDVKKRRSVSYIENGEKHETDKQKEIDALTTRVTGLDFDQFCKTTMLAQGDFRQFLNSDEGTKSALLEKILGDDIYTSMGIRIFQKNRELKKQAEDLQNRIESMPVKNEEELRALKEEIEQTSNKIEQTKNERRKQESIREWHEEDRKLKAEKARYEERLSTVCKEMESAEYGQSKRIIDLWRKTAELRQNMATERETAENIDKAKGSASAIKKDLGIALSHKMWCEKEAEKLAGEIGKMDKKIDEYAKQQSMFDCYEEIAEGVNTIKHMRQQNETEKKDIEGLQETKVKGQNAVNEAQTKYDEANKELVSKANELEEAKRELKDTDIALIDRLLSNLRKAETLCESWHTRREEYVEMERNVSNIEKEYEKVVGTLPSKIDELKKAIGERDEAERCYRLMKESFDTAATLRSTLQVGDSCPVCGNTITALLTEKEIENSLRPLSEEAKTKRENATKLQDEVSKMETNIKSLQESVASNRTILKNRENNMTRAYNELQKHLKESQIDVEINDEMKGLIEEMTKEKDTESIAAHSKQNVVDEKQKAKDEAQKKFDEGLNRLTTTKEYLNGILSTEKAKTGIVLNNIEKEGKLLGILLPKMTYEKSSGENIVEMFEQLKKDKDAHDKVVKAKGDSEEKQKYLNNAIKLSNASYENIMQTAKNWGSMSAEVVEIENEVSLIDEWRDIENRYVRLSEEIRSLQKTREKIMKVIDNFFAENKEIERKEVGEIMVNWTEEKIKIAEEYRQRMENNLAEVKGLCETTKNKIKENEEQCPMAKDEMMTAEEVAAKIEEIGKKESELTGYRGALEQQIKTDEENRQKTETIKANLKEINKKIKSWERLNEIFGDSTGKTFRIAAQRLILNDLLSHANRHLRELSAGRFALESQKGSLSILIRDAYNDYALSACSNLSGGEGFVVSLSLALGLSSMSGAMGINVDTIFIDEGFGTLDAEYLDRVMSMLEHLHDTNRARVGLISHVEELKDRIGTQIVVCRNKNNVSSVEVVKI